MVGKWKEKGRYTGPTAKDVWFSDSKKRKTEDQP